MFFLFLAEVSQAITVKGKALPEHVIAEAKG